MIYNILHFNIDFCIPFTLSLINSKNKVEKTGHIERHEIYIFQNWLKQPNLIYFRNR